MANYYTDFSFKLPFPQTTDERLSKFLMSYSNCHHEEPGSFPGFEVEVVNEKHDKTIYVFSDDGCGDLEEVSEFVRDFIEEFYPGERKAVVITWAEYCSKPRTDSFGGGALIVTEEGIVDQVIPDLVAEDRIKKANLNQL